MSITITETRWILVAGTGRNGIPKRTTDTSKRLGRELAEAGFGLVSGGWPGVDHIVARAFAEAVKEGRGRLVDRLTQYVERRRIPDFPSGRFYQTESDDKAWEASITKADAVVLIGGVGGTYGTGQRARRLGKPVFPLADTKDEGHDDAFRFYFEMLQHWGISPIDGLEVEDFLSLADPAPEVVGEVVRLAEKLFGPQPHRASVAPANRQSNREAALELWKEKLAFLLKEEAIAVDPDQKFRLKVNIMDAQEKLREIDRLNS